MFKPPKVEQVPLGAPMIPAQCEYCGALILDDEESRVSHIEWHEALYANLQAALPGHIL